MQINGKSVSRETAQRLDHFSSLFLKWARTTNLIAPSTVGELSSRHISDSAQIFQLVNRPMKWVDLGSGGGFPGIITAILLAEHNDGWVHLVESNQKKVAFLRVALGETGARGSVHNVRIENSYASIGNCGAVSARALADLDRLCKLAEPWLAHSDCKAYFHKGRDYQSELAKARRSWSFDVLEHASAVEHDSVVLEISNLRACQR